jgi:hypothetical protein
VETISVVDVAAAGSTATGELEAEVTGSVPTIGVETVGAMTGLVEVAVAQLPGNVTN